MAIRIFSNAKIHVFLLGRVLNYLNKITKHGYAGLTLVCFVLAFYVMSLVVRTMPLGVAYSVWAGGGIAGVTLIGAFVFEQELDGYGYLGVGLMTAGVIVLNALSSAASS